MNGEAGFFCSIRHGGARSRRSFVFYWTLFTRSDQPFITCTYCTVYVAARERLREPVLRGNCTMVQCNRLIAVEMQVDVLRRQSEAGKPIGASWGASRALLREEVLKVARTDAADEGDRCGFAALARRFE